MKGIVRFWSAMAMLSAGWSVFDMLRGDWAGSFAVALSGLVFVYLANRSDDPDFLS